MAYNYTIPQAPASGTTDPSADPKPSAPTTIQAFLGRGLLRPFRRDGKGDFANGEGAVLVKSCVGQILGTRASSDMIQGEIPWRPEFGSRFHLLKHRRNNLALSELARAYAQESIGRWEPRVRLTTCISERSDREHRTRVIFDVIDRNVPGNNVIIEGVEVTISG